MQREEALRFRARRRAVEAVRAPVDVLEVFHLADLVPDVAQELGFVAREWPRESVAALRERHSWYDERPKNCNRESHFRLLLPSFIDFSGARRVPEFWVRKAQLI